MSDSRFASQPVRESVFPRELAEDVPAEDGAPPEFGLVDVIEAFTAMRHEWRGQTKESRDVAAAIHTATTRLAELETKLLAQVASTSTDEARQLAELIADTDQQLARAVGALEQAHTQRRLREETVAEACQEYFRGMSRIARWFARPLLTYVLQLHARAEPSAMDPAVEGLGLVWAQLRRAMQERQIQRFDVLGQPFDAETMHALGTMASQTYPVEHVAEQIAPGYRWRGHLLRFATVRVAS